MADQQSAWKPVAEDTSAWKPVAAPQEKYPTFSKIPGFETVRPLADLAAGAGSGLAEHAVNAYDLLRKIPGADKILPDSKDFHKAIAEATPDNTPAHIGKFLEGAAEFMVPAGAAAKATKGAGLLARAGAQSAVGAGVSGVQSGGDPTAMATGAALGAGGEVLGDAARGVASIVGKKAPSIANFSESFGGATPTQKARITKALGTLERDGIVPPDSVHETQDVIKGKLDDLGQAYQNLDPAIRARAIPFTDAVKPLEDAKEAYTRRGVITEPSAYKAVQNQIDTLKEIATQNGDMVQLDDLIHMKQLANGKTNFASPDADKSLWRGIGDAYRKTADALAPETTPLNRDYQHYKDLEQIVDQNIARGKGVAPTGLDLLLNKAAGHGVGAAVGGAAAGPIGAVAGGIAGPKIMKATQQAIQNAVDSGAFAKLIPAKQALVSQLVKMGDNAGVLKVLGVSSMEQQAAQK